jgi:hypothetical protein
MVDFDSTAARRKISKEAREILDMAERLGYHLSWASQKQQAVAMTSPFDDRKLLLPMNSINANRLRSLGTQLVRHADPDVVKAQADLLTISNRNRKAGKIPLTFDIASDNDIVTQRGGMPLSADVERALNEARIRLQEKEDEEARAQAQVPVPTPPPARADDYVPADTHVLTEKPWMVRKGGHEGGSGTMYESHSVIHRVWSDGHEDYRCRFCAYTSDNPRGVAGHASRTKTGHPASTDPVETHRVNEYVPTEIKRPLSGIRRLTTELTLALDAMQDWCDMPREDLARALAEHVYAMRPDREPAAPLTPEQILHRITLMVDSGRLAEMHQQVEATAAALRETQDDMARVSVHAAEMEAQAAELEAQVEGLREERRALAAMLTDAD